MADPRMPFGGRGPEGKQMRAPDVNPIAQKEGGVPFYGNLYQGRVKSMDYNPTMASMARRKRLFLSCVLCTVMTILPSAQSWTAVHTSH